MPLRESELLTIVISVIWVRIAGAAASPGFLGRGASRWMGPGVCEPWVGSRAKAYGWPEGECVNIPLESQNRPGKVKEAGVIRGCRTAMVVSRAGAES